jgi:hypothetical protein
VPPNDILAASVFTHGKSNITGELRFNEFEPSFRSVLKKPVSAGRRQQRRRATGSPRSLVRDAAIDRFD